MKVFIKSLATSLFVAVSGGWTANVEEAMDFRRGLKAIDCAHERKLHQAALAYSFDDPKFNFVIPIEFDSAARNRTRD